MQLTTQRLILRNVKKEDANDIYEYSKHPEVGPNAGWKPHESVCETGLLIDEIFLDKEGIFAVVYNGKVIGTAGLLPDPKRENGRAQMLGYALGREYWGKGIMTEAAKAIIDYGFNVLGLEIISAYCYPYNERSKSVIKKCGFTYEGTLRRCELRYDGVILDNECYSIVKP